MRTMGFRRVDGCFIVAHGVATPTDHEWSAFLGAFARHGVYGAQRLVFTDGGFPSPQQQARLRTIIKRRLVPTAVVSDNRRIYMTARVASWFNGSTDGFRVADLEDAFDFLRIPNERRGIARAALRELRDLNGYHRN
jgi:hypothetical protein